MLEQARAVTYKNLLMLNLLILFTSVCLAAPLDLEIGASSKVCDHIYLVDGKLNLNQNEKVLICGSPQGAEGWQEIPLAQAEFHLKTILHNLGYLDPKFQRDDKSLTVTMGPISIIKKLVVYHNQDILRAGKKRKVIGYPLTSVKLDEIEAWANLETRSNGYTCPEIQVIAQGWNSTVAVDTHLQSKKKFGDIAANGLDNLDPGVLSRYRPFQPGEIYDIRKTQLMTSRMLSDGLFQSAHFTTKCVGNIAELQLHTSIGKPKIFRFGVGASTEEFPFLDMTFRNARLDNKASFFTTNLHASPRELSLSVGSELYFIPGSNRTYLGPRFRAARLIEDAYETDSAKLGADLGRNWDLWGHRLNLRGGPTFNYTKNIRGVGPEGDSVYPSVEGTFQIASHVYESGVRDQYTGWTSQLYYRSQSKGLGSEINFHRYRLDLKKLWNIGHLSPPLFVLGTRLETTMVDADALTTPSGSLLPVEDRLYMGGDQNLRGFARQSLNNQELGYLTGLYLGFELRLIEQLPYHLQPFLLWDVARLGTKRYTLDRPIFTSEGVGLRWASPFGTLRGSFAKGRVLNKEATSLDYPENWILFISFGQEF